MITLLLWRHAKTETAEPGQSDRDRRLLPVGREDAEAVARRLVADDLVPDVIVCSHSVRTRETASVSQDVFPAHRPQIDIAELYGASASEYLDLMATYAPPLSPHRSIAKILLIGHNPAIEEFTSLATERPTPMRPGALAVITTDTAQAATLGACRSLAVEKFILPPRYP